MQKIFVHIGFHKCGSTSLINNFYSKHSEITHLGKPYPSDSPVREIVERIIEEKPREYKKNVCEQLQNTYISPLLNSNKIVTLIDGRIGTYNADKQAEIAKRVKEIFNDPKIIIVIRNQEDLVVSLYNQYIGTSKTNDPFPKWLNENWSKEIDLSNNLNYYNKISIYADIFGKENICILTLEEMRDNLKLFTEKLCSFIGVDSQEAYKLMNSRKLNQRMSQLQLFLRKYSFGRYAIAMVKKFSGERIQIYSRKILRMLPKVDPKLSAEWKKIFAREFEKSNTLLEEEFGIHFPAGFVNPN